MGVLRELLSKGEDILRFLEHEKLCWLPNIRLLHYLLWRNNQGTVSEKENLFVEVPSLGDWPSAEKMRGLTPNLPPSRVALCLSVSSSFCSGRAFPCLNQLPKPQRSKMIQQKETERVFAVSLFTLYFCLPKCVPPDGHLPWSCHLSPVLRDANAMGRLPEWLCAGDWSDLK